MFGLKKYNYETFTKDLLIKDMAVNKLMGGPRPGDRAPDFEGRTLDGDKVRLKKFRGEKNVVLTFGSATCPMTAGSIRGLNDLYDEFDGDDVQFLFVYVREAHPGEALAAHRSMRDKIHAAEVLRDEEDIEMPVVVDDLDGSIHRKFDKLPNSTYIIDKSGRIAFHGVWAQPAVIAQALEELLERQRERNVEHVVVHGGEDRSMPLKHALLHSHRALVRGGDKAIEDFRQALGTPGKVVVAASRVVAPVALHPVKTILTAALAAGAITGGIIAGNEMRRRLRGSREPYRFPPKRRYRGSDYEAVGI